MYWRGLTILVKLRTEHLRKLILPENDCITFFLHGRVYLPIASVLLGSIVIPSFDTTKPSNFPSVIVKMEFLGFNEMPYFL